MQLTVVFPPHKMYTMNAEAFLFTIRLPLPRESGTTQVLVLSELSEL